MKSTNELTAKEANAIMIMLEESLEAHFAANDFGDIADWEYFDLDAARLTAYQKFRAWYEDKYGARNET